MAEMIMVIILTSTEITFIYHNYLIRLLYSVRLLNNHNFELKLNWKQIKI